MKAIIVKATGAQVQFGKTAAETHRILAQVGVVIGKSTVKLIQNGTKQSACGIEVVELKEEKKVKAKRVSKVWEQFTTEIPELKRFNEKGYKIGGTKIVGGKRFEATKDGVTLYFNMGKRGVSMANLTTKERQMFATVDDMIATVIA